MIDDRRRSDHGFRRVPRPVSRFFGREAELAAIRQFFGTGRIVTLVGFGGLGKTRTAQRFAELAQADFPDGIFFIEAEGCAEAAELMNALSGHFADRRFLIIFDGCDGALDRAAASVTAIAQATELVSILCTSREALRIAGERVLTIAPLTLPPADVLIGPAEAMTYSAVNMFVDRARLGNPHFAVTPSTVGYVSSICRRVDGIPLAIELAATWVPSLSIRALEAHISRRGPLLARGTRDSQPQHVSIRAVVDRSYATLDRLQRRVLARISIFAATFSLEAAIRVCSDDDVDEWEVINSLHGLVDKSLVVAKEEHGSMHYDLLETLRGYAADRLREGGEEAFCAQRRDRWCLEAARASGQLTSNAFVTNISPNRADFVRLFERELTQSNGAENAAALVTGPLDLLDETTPMAVIELLESLARDAHRLSVDDRGRLWLQIARYHACTESDHLASAVAEARRLVPAIAHPIIKIRLLQQVVEALISLRKYDDVKQMCNMSIRMARSRGDRGLEENGLELLRLYHLRTNRIRRLHRRVPART